MDVAKQYELLSGISGDKIEALEACLKTLPQVDLQTTFTLSGKVYARTIFLPAGTVIVGATHRKDHVNICQGDISVSTEAGIKRFTGQHTFPAIAGTKRVAIAHSDTWWTAVCYTELTDPSEIEDELVVESAKLMTRNPDLTGNSLLQIKEI